MSVKRKQVPAAERRGFDYEVLVSVSGADMHDAVANDVPFYIDPKSTFRVRFYGRDNNNLISLTRTSNKGRRVETMTFTRHEIALMLRMIEYNDAGPLGKLALDQTYEDL